MFAQNGVVSDEPWKYGTLDISVAFLNAKLARTVLLQLPSELQHLVPKGWTHGAAMELRVAVDGLKDSPRL